MSQVTDPSIILDLEWHFSLYPYNIFDGLPGLFNIMFTFIKWIRIILYLCKFQDTVKLISVCLVLNLLCYRSNSIVLQIWFIFLLYSAFESLRSPRLTVIVFVCNFLLREMFTIEFYQFWVKQAKGILHVFFNVDHLPVHSRNNILECKSVSLWHVSPRYIHLSFHHLSNRHV